MIFLSIQSRTANHGETSVCCLIQIALLTKPMIFIVRAHLYTEINSISKLQNQINQTKMFVFSKPTSSYRYEVQMFVR